MNFKIIVYSLCSLSAINVFSLTTKIEDENTPKTTSEKVVLKKNLKSHLVKDSVSKKSSGIEKISENEFNSKINENSKKYSEEVNKKFEDYYSGPIVVENNTKIKSLDSFAGIIKDSLLLTQNPSEVVIFFEEPNGLLFESKLRCLGSVFFQRVKIYCDLLITPNKELAVKVLIKEKLDGTTTLLPNKYYTGEEASFIKQSFSSFFAGAMDASKDRVLTPNGQEDLNNPKNKIYTGLFGIANNANSEVKNQAATNEIAAVIDAGRPVTIEFLEGVKNE